MTEFTVAGVAIRDTFDFPDPSVPDGTRRVSARWATLRQMQADGRTSGEGMAKVAEKVGAPDNLLWDHRD